MEGDQSVTVATGDAPPRKKARTATAHNSHRVEAARSFAAYEPKNPFHFSPANFNNLIYSCLSCRNRKIKCSGTQPCRYCVKKHLDCVIAGPGKRKLYSVEYVEELEGRVAAGTETASLSRNLQSSASTPAIDTEAGGPSPPDLVTSSSLHFGQEITSLGALPSPAFTIVSSEAVQRGWTLSPPSDAYGIASGFGHSSCAKPILPNLEEAHHLLDKVLSSLGKLHHLFDPREFCDKLSSAYEDSESTGPDIDQGDLWYVHFLMVMALGKLLLGKENPSGGLPGTELYLEAERRLPQPLALRRIKTTLGIEILGMMAFFLQCADLREDAYIYVSGSRVPQL